MKPRWPLQLAPYQIRQILDEASPWVDSAVGWKSEQDRERAREFRDRMSEALRSRNYEAAEAWGRLLEVCRWIERRESFLVPLAAIGVRVKPRLPGKGERVSLYEPKMTAVERKSRNQRIQAAHRAGKASAEIARAEGVDVRTVQRVLKE